MSAPGQDSAEKYRVPQAASGPRRSSPTQPQPHGILSRRAVGLPGLDAVFPAGRPPVPGGAPRRRPSDASDLLPLATSGPQLPSPARSNDPAESTSACRQQRVRRTTMKGAQGAARGAKGRRKRTNLCRYLKGQQLGQGAYGIVYQGIDTLTGKFVAIKEVKADTVREELSTLQVLNHRNIVRYIDYELADGGMMLIYLELVEGGSLASVLSQFGCLAEPVVRAYTGQTVQGLRYLHSQGVSHRDIKPANLLVTSDGTVKLADFGTAATLFAKGTPDAPGGKGVASLVGTPQYLSPEAIRGHHSRSADVWALGCTVVELKTGKPPWHGVIECEIVMEFILKVANSKLVPACPPGMSEDGRRFVDRCLKREQKDRSSCAELAEADWLTQTMTEEQLAAEVGCQLSPNAFGGTSKSLQAGLDSPRGGITQNVSVCDTGGEVGDITGLFIGVHLCNDTLAESLYETIDARGESSIMSPAFGCSLRSGQQRRASGCDFAAAEAAAAEEFVRVEGTSDGLVTMYLSEVDSPGFDVRSRVAASVQTPLQTPIGPGFGCGGDTTFKFDVFFDTATSPRDLYTAIGEPMLSALMAGIKPGGGPPKRVALWCTSMLWAGESAMAIGRTNQDVSIFDASGDGLGLLPLIIRQLYRRFRHYDIHVSSVCAKQGKNGKVYDNIGHKLVADVQGTRKWETLGPVVRRHCRDEQTALRKLGLAQIAFTGCMSPHLFVFELRKGTGPIVAQLFVSLYYCRQWTYWLNGLTQLIYRHFSYRAATGEEDESRALHASQHGAAPLEELYATNPLLSIAEEVFEDEHSMNFVLHNFHQQKREAYLAQAALNALRNASVGRSAPVRMRESKEG
eukprot:TRINITY_DN20875_c0_g1_i1.p1 TRINITY_DN20875_c0_g1~~TRINITY_DN20875_c0_g1_i1.p1  ORF type:complete len:853 (+),score=237.58 TRINITY_DN20875_c0_g1_i1:118-2676(+)